MVKIQAFYDAVPSNGASDPLVSLDEGVRDAKTINAQLHHEAHAGPGKGSMKRVEGDGSVDDVDDADEAADAGANLGTDVADDNFLTGKDALGFPRTVLASVTLGLDGCEDSFENVGLRYTSFIEWMVLGLEILWSFSLSSASARLQREEAWLGVATAGAGRMPSPDL